MSKADDIKQMRLDGVSMEPREASGRRKRAFHRALKRGAPWAVIEDAHRRITIKVGETLWGCDLLSVVYDDPLPIVGLSSLLSKVNEDDSKT